MRISLFIPCFVDQFFPQVGLAMADVLEKLGHSVDAPAAQTCCGQPAFNMGYTDEARRVGRHALEVFEASDLVAVCSGSCATMLKVFLPDLFQKGTAEHARASVLAARTHEFCDLLVNRLGVEDVGAKFPHRVTYHDGCHALRELGLKNEPRALLRNVQGLELVEMGEAETCCGFGGAFSVKFETISTAMAERKCASIAETDATHLVSADPSCLMQMQGLMNRRSQRITCMHIAEVLNHQS